MLLKLTEKKISLLLIIIVTIVVTTILLQRWIDPVIVFSLIALVAAGVIGAFFNINFLFTILILSIPVSISFSAEASETSILIPSELLIALLSIIAFSKLLFGNDFLNNFIKHPITRCIIFYFIVQLITVPFSNLPIVSLKFIIVRLCYLLVFYFIAHLYLKQKLSSGIRIYTLYALSLIPVAIYVLYRHSMLNLARDAAAVMPEPFYNDHTIYGACIAFVLPAIAGLFIYTKQFGFVLIQKLLLLLGLILLSVALFFSYSRGAWISVIVSILFMFIVLLQLPSKLILFIAVLLSSLLYNYSDEIWLNIRHNKADSNVKNVNLNDIAKSVTNINNDLSNAERLNRWSCALRMAQDKPFSGHGPGTYQFNYLPYQLKDEMTWISVNSPYNNQKGRGGTAHSEYFLLLAESGVLSLLSFLLLIFMVLYYGVKCFYSLQNKQLKISIMAVLMGFVSYITHGLFNNFLDTDKAAFLFWGSISFIATIDWAEKKRRKQLQINK